MVGLGVVGEDASADHAVLPVPGGCTLEEADTGVRVLAGQQLGVSEPRVVVDRDVQVLPADATVAVRAAGVSAEDALAWFPKTTETLGVDVSTAAAAPIQQAAPVRTPSAIGQPRSAAQPPPTGDAAAGAASTADHATQPNHRPGSAAKADTPSRDSRRRWPQPAADSSPPRFSPRSRSATPKTTASVAAAP